MVTTSPLRLHHCTIYIFTYSNLPQCTETLSDLLCEARHPSFPLLLATVRHSLGSTPDSEYGSNEPDDLRVAPNSPSFLLAIARTVRWSRHVLRVSPVLQLHRATRPSDMLYLFAKARFCVLQLLDMQPHLIGAYGTPTVYVQCLSEIQSESSDWLNSRSENTCNPPIAASAVSAITV